MTFNYRSRVSGAVFVAGVEISKNIIKIREKQLCRSIHFYVDPAPPPHPAPNPFLHGAVWEESTY